MWYHDFMLSNVGVSSATIVQKTFVMDSGERYCLLIEADSGLPLYFPNLYITTQVRNKSLSCSAMEGALSGISVLIRFLSSRSEDIESRFRCGSLFDESEMDAIRDFCQIRFRGHASKIVLSGQATSEPSTYDVHVSSETEYVRLTVISQYTKWLAEQLVELSKDRSAILRMERGFKSRRPIKRKRNIENDEKGLTEEQITLLFEIFRPESESNPFKDTSVRTRNRLIFLMLYHLGLRGGELLNVRVRDIDFGKNQLVIARRADEKDDPRRYQPLVKTRDRRIPMKESLAKEVHHYILNERKGILNSNKNDFLFVTHKSGPTQGQPLSKSGYKKIIEVIRDMSPSMSSLTGHQLRHTWNEMFSNHMDSMDEPPDHEQQEKIRSYLMGWKEGSGSASTYNKRFIKKKANEAALKLQEGMIKRPKGINNGK